MTKIRIYLAGPEVFLRDSRAIGARKKMLCEELGFVGLYPLDHDLTAASGETLDEKIYAANIALMRQADAGLFNLTPFRGVNADPGTAFELGFFAALGKPVFAYTHSAAPLFDRVSVEFGLQAKPEGDHCDEQGLLIENFGNADNLMLDAALKGQGRKILRPDATIPGLDDLTLFTACLRQARVHFGF